MNRRDFLKGGLGGVFGMFLTWAGAVKAEEPIQDQNSQAYKEFAASIERPALTDDEKRQAFEARMLEDGCFAFCPSWDICRHYVRHEDLPCLGASWNYSPETGDASLDLFDLFGPGNMILTDPPDKTEWPQGTTWFVDLVDGDDASDGLTPETALLSPGEAYSRCAAPSGDVIFSTPGGMWPESATSDQALDAIVESANKWNERLSDNVSWGYRDDTGSDLGRLFSQNGQIDWPRTRAVLEEVGILSGDYNPETGGEWNPWPLYAGPEAEYETIPIAATADLTACTHSYEEEEWPPAPRGAVIGFSARYPEGRTVHWDVNGSDENGTGTTKDPVATKACAQAIANSGALATEERYRQALAGHLIHEGVFQSRPGFSPNLSTIHWQHIRDAVADAEATVIVYSRLVVDGDGETTVDVYRNPNREQLALLCIDPLADKPLDTRIAHVAVYDRLLSDEEIAFLSSQFNKDRT